MRSKFLVCAGLAVFGVFAGFVSAAHAADAKDKTKKPNELHADDKSMKKQLQWEDKVMGPDSKRAELDKIARASAINEKAAKDREKQSALDATAPAPKVASRKVDARSEVAIPASAEEKALNADSGHAVEISPKLSTEAAAAATDKPADDKFIDKLLREEGTPSTKHASANDKELEELLAGAKEKPAGRKAKGDKVDDLIKSADKGPAMPAPRAPTALPDWTRQPDIAPSAPSPPPPVAARAAAKSDGVIHVVQGAANAAPGAAAPLASRGGRKNAARATKAPVVWNDPFADGKAVAARDRQATLPAPKKELASRPSAAPSTEWSDPFADSPEPRKTTRHTSTSSPVVTPTSAPKRGEKSDPNAHPGNANWKDPFTKATSEPSGTPVAMRELGKGEPSKWEIATHRAAPALHATTTADRHVGAWGVLKKRR